MRWPALLLLMMILSALPAAAQQNAPEATARIGTGPRQMLIRSTTDISIIRPALERFTALNPDLSIAYEQWNSNPLYDISRRACAGDAPAADVVFSSAVQQMLNLVNRACARPYRSDRTASLPASRRWRDELWGLTEEPAVIIYNPKLIPPGAVPKDRFELLDLMRGDQAGLTGKIATYDIEASGLGYLFAYSDSLEATTFGALLEGFARTTAIATCCSAEIIEGVSSGRYALAYNVLGSYAANRRMPDVNLVLPQDYTLFLSRAMMIPRRASNPDGAERLLDFLLGQDGQTLMEKAGLIYPDDPAETHLLPGARRYISLPPSLLVALDAQKRAHFSAVWSQNFISVLPAP